MKDAVRHRNPQWQRLVTHTHTHTHYSIQDTVTPTAVTLYTFSKCAQKCTSAHCITKPNAAKVKERWSPLPILVVTSTGTIQQSTHPKATTHVAQSPTTIQKLLRMLANDSCYTKIQYIKHKYLGIIQLNLNHLKLNSSSDKMHQQKGLPRC